MSVNNKRGNSEVFSPDNTLNKAVRRNSEPSKMASPQHDYQQRLDNPLITHSQPNQKDLHTLYSDDDYDGLLMDTEDDKFEPKMVKIPDGIELFELRKKFPTLPEWIAGFTAYLSNSISKDIGSEINASLEYNCNKFKDLYKNVEAVVNSKLHGINTQLEGMSNRVKNLETAKSELESENEALKQKLQNQEQYTRRSNLVISGIHQAHRNENLFRWFDNFSYYVLGIEKRISIERIHRVGPPPVVDNPEYSRPIMIRFSFYQDREMVWDSKHVLKGSKVFISEDQLPEVQEAQKRLWPVANEAKDQKMRATVIGDKLIVNSKQYTTSTLKNLPPSLHPISISQS